MSERNVDFKEDPLSQLALYARSNRKQKIIDCLMKLKSDQDRTNELLRNSSLAPLVKLLSYQNEQILNLVLSILATACLCLDIRNEIYETKIITQTLWIIKNLHTGMSLHSRACRLIRNLCESAHHARSFHDAGAVKVLTSVLNARANSATLLMAVRALRNLWHNCDDSREKIIQVRAIESITRILENTVKYPEHEQPELAKACLKAMCTFISNLDPRVADQLRASGSDVSYQTLLKYCKANNRMALQLLYHLCHMAQCRPDLGKSGAVEVLVELAAKDESLSPHVMTSLCLFCREAINRYRVRTSSGLELMLAMLQNDKYKQYHPSLLHALTNFVNDDKCVVIMVKNGLVDVITGRLGMMSESQGCPEDDGDEEMEEEERSAKKRCCEAPTQADAKQRRLKTGRYSLDYPDYTEWSPKSTTSESYSPPYSPPTTSEDCNMEDSAEENYSPVCSDSELNENEGPEEELESLKSCGSMTCDSENGTTVPVARQTVDSDVNSTLILLSRLSFLDGPVEKLADSCVIEPLVGYIKMAKNLRALRILLRIIRNNVYLMSLVKQGFVFEAQTMFGSEQCTRQLCNLASTGGAIGEFMATLNRGHDSLKSITAVSIPFLITSKPHLRSLLNVHGGLRLIFQVLNDREHHLYDNAIWAICRLALSLDIRPETVDKSLGDDSRRLLVDPGAPRTATVTFELDDGTTVDACRRTLCQRSAAFTAMLEGSFCEAGKRRVKLTNTSKGGLHTLLLALDGAAVDDNEIESLLDAVLLADKFLMDGVVQSLTESSVSKLSHENYSRAWHWARKNSCDELKSCCVKSFLTTEMTRAQRGRAFEDFSSRESFPEFLKEMWEIINEVLCQR